ncbi:interaptin-like [Battus philenor]|uniref:interaptin-like n=1 Tax=Battus philenor TaxID=42288 RepID=UPI0035D031F7
MERNLQCESKRTGSPFQKDKETQPDAASIVHEETLQKTTYDVQKEKNNELLQKINKKTAEYQSNKPSSGVFTEVVAHGAFTSKKVEKEKAQKVESVTPAKYGNGSNGSKSLLGYPSSANDLALDAKSDLESDPNISEEVKEKVIEKLFKLVSMVQHTYESKVRIMTDYEKFKDTHLKNEIRREKEHSEQLYKLNMNFQNEVIQAVQQLKSELDLSRVLANNIDESNSAANLESIDLTLNDDQTSNRNINEEVIEEQLVQTSELVESK